MNPSFHHQYDHKKERKPKKASPLSMVSFSGVDSNCMRSFSKQNNPATTGDGMTTLFIEPSPRFTVASDNRGFWPASASISGKGRTLTVTVDHDDVDHINGLVETYGGTIQED